VIFVRLLLVFSLLSVDTFAKVLDVDFEESVGLKRLGKAFFTKQDCERYDRYLSVYEKRRPSLYPMTGKEKIPKFFHFLWFSEKPPSKRVQANLASWVEHHPQWGYKIWTIKEVENLDAELSANLKRASTQQQKEDLVRIYLLKREGGVVVDLAFQNLYPIDELVSKYHFFAFLEPPLAKRQFSRRLHVATSFIGAAASHPVILAWDEATKLEPESCLLFGKSVDSLLDSELYINIIFPPTYAFPINPRWAKVSGHRQKNSLYSSVTKVFRSFVSWFEEEPLFSEVKPESIAIHAQGGTWADNKKIKLRKNNRDAEN